MAPSDSYKTTGLPAFSSSPTPSILPGPSFLPCPFPTTSSAYPRNSFSGNSKMTQDQSQAYAPFNPIPFVRAPTQYPNYTAQSAVGYPYWHPAQSCTHHDLGNHVYSAADYREETDYCEESDDSDEEDWDFEEDGEGGESEEDEDLGSDDDDDDDDDESWARDPKNLRDLEELRWWFRTELEDPSAWTLQRIKALTQSERSFAAREFVKRWRFLVAQSTRTPGEAELRLPDISRLVYVTPFHKTLTWDEAEAGGFCFVRDVEERYKRDARLTIMFLFPEAHIKGLTAGERGTLYAIASKIWMVHYSRAEGLLWVLSKEFYNTQEEDGREYNWANSMSEDFMTYTVLYPPPIAMGY